MLGQPSKIVEMSPSPNWTASNMEMIPWNRTFPGKNAPHLSHFQSTSTLLLLETGPVTSCRSHQLMNWGRRHDASMQLRNPAPPGLSSHDEMEMSRHGLEIDTPIFCGTSCLHQVFICTMPHMYVKFYNIPCQIAILVDPSPETFSPFVVLPMASNISCL